MKKTTKYFLSGTAIILFIIIAFVVYRKKKKQKQLGNLDSELIREHVSIKQKNGKTKDIPLIFSGWFAPYDENNKTNLPKITKKKYGVYFFRSRKTKEVIYIGHSSSNLYKALYRHFQIYNDSDKQIRNYYAARSNYEVMVAISSKQNAYKLERHFILEYNPRDTTHKYEKYHEESKIQEIPDIETIETWEEIPSEKQDDFPEPADAPF